MLLFENVLADPIGQAVLNGSYPSVFRLLAEATELGAVPPGDPWQQHLLGRILVDENPFSLKCEAAGFEAVGPSVLAAAANDLAQLRRLFALEVHASNELPPLSGLRPMKEACLPPDEIEIRRALAASTDWAEMVPTLGQYYAAIGVSQLARFRAFRWIGGPQPLQVVAQPDPVRLTDLVGYDDERELVLRNTAAFVAGHLANNVLIYGDRGTGKSSTVKALVNEHGDRGLRLIEVPKALLGDLTEILGHLRHRRERFVLFVDDLSFDDHETHYKDLKAVLEGGIESRPQNVVLYATSNRRHLVQERFGDRRGVLDEVHTGDSHQEKLSFSDRFGIAVTFAEPDQERYLRIVAALASARRLEIPAAELRRRALEWAAWQNGRSGRTARQYIDFVAAEA